MSEGEGGLLFGPPMGGRTLLVPQALVLVIARALYRYISCMMAEGGGPESGSAADSDSEPVTAQIPTPSSESQKQTIGSLLKTPLKKGDEW